MNAHRYRIGEEVRVIRTDSHGFPAPVGSLLTVGRHCDDGWYQTPNGTRFAPHEVEAFDPQKHPTPTHVTVTKSRWEDIRHANDRIVELLAAVRERDNTIARVREVLDDYDGLDAEPIPKLSTHTWMHEVRAALDPQETP